MSEVVKTCRTEGCLERSFRANLCRVHYWQIDKIKQQRAVVERAEEKAMKHARVHHSWIEVAANAYGYYVIEYSRLAALLNDKTRTPEQLAEKYQVPMDFLRLHGIRTSETSAS